MSSNQSTLDSSSLGHNPFAPERRQNNLFQQDNDYLSLPGKEEAPIQVVVMAPIFGFFGKVDTKVWYSLLVLMLLICHICIGSHVFKLLETGEVAREKIDDQFYQGNLIKHFTTVRGVLRADNQTYDYLVESDFDKMLSLYKTRCFKTDNTETDSRMWNFWTSLDFASTIVTTIGYGGMAPRTDMGKLFVIIYTIPGMLIMMSYLNIFSTCILILLRKIIKMIRKLASLDRLPDLIEQGIVLSISLIFLALYLVVMATMMHLNNPKNDSFPQSLYFYVITMTTVGFGDITLIDHTYLALIRVLFVFCIGLVMVSLVFNAIREMAAAYQRRLVEVSQRIAMKTLAVAKQHRMNHHMGAIENGNEKLIDDD